MSRGIWILLVALTLAPAVPERVAAQGQLGRAAIGAGLGVAGGTAVTIAAVVARARFQSEYLDSAHDLIHWQSTPLIVGPIAGVIFGLAGDEALRGSLYGSLGGMLTGAAVGAGLGYLLSEEQEWPWAGGVIGAGLGLAAGGIVYGVRGWSEDPAPSIDFPDFVRIGVTVPLP